MLASDSPARTNPVMVLIKGLRVYQWSKNLLLFAALIFAQEVFRPEQLVPSVLAFFSFCLAASATYLFNDIQDIEKDRAHPKKRHRPIASGEMPLGVAWALLIALFAGSCVLAWLVRPAFLPMVFAYIGLTLSYSLFLKHMMIVDVMVLALGFVVRAIAGAVAINVQFSNWLVVCTLFLALFLGFSKRRHEITLLEDGAESHRAVLSEYSVQYLDQLILIVAGGAILTYTIYTCSPDVVQRLHTDKLYLTLPYVLFGIFRYLHLIHHKTGGGDPSRTLVTDKPLILTVLLWGGTCIGIIYAGRVAAGL
ncbi:MAG: decaprenyl-phosphate phosphoribosyltransferase [Candidatus Hydrogenedens sp.]|nr:decaprenyl-phosphate phosphoribosyltransferase [Candidatus Hydrogenedens sp.]